MKNITIPIIVLFFNLTLTLTPIHLNSQITSVPLFSLPANGCKDVGIQFAAAVNAAAGGEYQWEVDGTSFSTLQRPPAYKFSTPGEHTVKLTFKPKAGQALLTEIRVDNCIAANDPIFPGPVKSDPYFILYNAAGAEFDRSSILWDQDEAPPAFTFKHPVFVSAQSTKIKLLDYDFGSNDDFMGEIILENPVIAGTYASGAGETYVKITINPTPAAAAYTWSAKINVLPPPNTPTLTYNESTQTLICQPNNAGTLTYEWYKDNSQILNINTPSLTPECSGTYTVKISNGTCNAVSNAASINIANLIAVDYNAENQLLTAKTSIKAPVYQWYFNKNLISGSDVNIWKPNCSGTYTVKVSSTSCSSTSTETAVTVPPLTLTATAATCAGGSNGTVFINGCNGVTAPYDYSWSNGKTTPYIGNLAAGTYTVTVRYQPWLYCKNTGTITLAQPPAINIDVVKGGGSITINVSGGKAPYQYDWADIAGTNNPQNRAGLPPGTYTLTVTDANGCTQTSVIALATVASKDENHQQSIKISPNPVSDLLYIEGLDQKTTVIVWSPDGKQCIKTALDEGNHLLEVDALVPGVYLLQLQTLHGNISKQFVKM